MFQINLKRLRKINNISQEQLANDLGYSKQAVSNWEQSKNLPSVEVMKKLSNYFNVTIDELIADKDIDEFEHLKTLLKANKLIDENDNISRNDIEMLMKQFEIYKQYKNKDN